MILTIGEWKFDIDMETTMQYSANEAKEHCDCGYCRNFYAAMDKKYPSVRPFLAQFGLDMEGPDELIPVYDHVDGDSGCVCVYEGSYTVSGQILQQGSPLQVDGIPVYPELQSQINTQCPAPRFFLRTELFSLPWVLAEPFEEVLSPANEPGFLNRIIEKLLGREKPTQIQ